MPPRSALPTTGPPLPTPKVSAPEACACCGIPDSPATRRGALREAESLRGINAMAAVDQRRRRTRRVRLGRVHCTGQTARFVGCRRRASRSGRQCHPAQLKLADGRPRAPVAFEPAGSSIKTWRPAVNQPDCGARLVRKCRSPPRAGIVSMAWCPVLTSAASIWLPRSMRRLPPRLPSRWNCAFSAPYLNPSTPQGASPLRRGRASHVLP